MKIFSRFPVFRLVVPFSAGILCTIKSEISLTTLLVTATAGFLLSFLFTQKNYATGKYAQRWLAGIPFYCCFFGLGGSLTWLHQSNHFNNHFYKYARSGFLLTEIISEPVVTLSGLRFTAKVTAVKSDHTWKPVRGKLLIFISDSLHSFKGLTGSKIIVSGQVKTISGSTNPAAFNAADFYAGKGTWHRMYVGEGRYDVLPVPINKDVFTYARLLRDNLLKKLQLHLGSNDLGVAGALLLGYEDWLDPELENYWSGAGVLHVLCVSGMHVMLIYAILAGLTGWMEKNRLLRHIRFLLLMMMIWFYAMVTGFSPSVIRAAAMISFVIAGNWINREASIYNLLCSSCILMFIMDPYLIISVGFQLSFLAVCGIIFLHKLIMPLWTAPNKLLHKIWELVSVSLAAQLSTFPLSLFLFHQFPNYFLIGNLLIIPLSTAVMYSGLLLLVTDWIPYAGLLTGTVTSYGIQALNYLVITIGRLPGALTENIFFNGLETLLLYLLLIFIPVWLVYKSRTWLFICLILVTILLSDRIILLWKRSATTEFTVYDSRSSTLISYIHGRNAILIMDVQAESKNISYVSGQHLINKLVTNPKKKILIRGQLIQLSIPSIGEIYVLKDWKKNYLLPLNLKVYSSNILILGGHLSVDVIDIINKLRPKQVIFDSSCKPYQVKKLEAGLAKAGIKTFNVRQRGAFQL